MTKKSLTNKKSKLPLVVAILGPTASGKSYLAVELAKKFKGEIISADSRQVYKGMDLGTGKIKAEEMQGIPHHLLSIVDPKEYFSVLDFTEKAKKLIFEINKKGKLPFLVGGSWLYIQATLEDWKIPRVKPNFKLRKELEKKSLKELQEILANLDPQRFKTVDIKNKRRLIRAIEIAQALGKVPKLKKEKIFNYLKIGIDLNFKELEKKIKKRLLERIKLGMIQEVENLLKKGVPPERLKSFGLEYKWITLFLENKINKEQMIEKLYKNIRRFAKKQMNTFKKDKEIFWIKDKISAEKLILKFLNQENLQKQTTE